MTREEAIQVLTDIKRIRSEKIAKAIDMAIEALSADSVSREDYEDIIKDYRKQYENMNNEIADLEAKLSLVLCKDCKHYEKHETWSACTLWTGDPYEQANVNGNDFCSYGERR